MAGARDGDEAGEAVAGEGDAVAPVDSLHGIAGGAVVERQWGRKGKRQDREIEKVRFCRIRDPDEAFAADDVGAVGIGNRDNRHIDLPAIEQRPKLRRRGADHAQFHIRMGGAEPFEQARQERDRIIFRAAQRQRSLQGDAVHVGEDFVVAGQQCLCMGEQFFAGRRQPHARSAAMQQRMADKAFQPLDLHAERRLRAPDLRGGNADRASARNHGKVLQERKVEHAKIIRIVDVGLK